MEPIEEMLLTGKEPTGKAVTYPGQPPNVVARVEFRFVDEDGRLGEPHPVRVASDGTHARVEARCPSCRGMPILVKGTKQDRGNGVVVAPAMHFAPDGCGRVVGVLAAYLEVKKNREQRRAEKRAQRGRR